MKCYDAAGYIGHGSEGFYFLLKGYPHLGVKVLRDNSKSQLKKELRKAKILRGLNLPVPRHIGIVNVRINNELLNESKLNLYSGMLHPEYWYGLVIEFIDDGLEFVEAKQVDANYYEALKQIGNYGIKVQDSYPGVRNVLWCKRRKKIYLIDYERWHIPLKYYLKIF